MPEGDTVWRACKRLNEALGGRELTRTDFRVPALATVDLNGRTMTEVVARGKHLLMRVSDGVTIHSHLRMDGSWHLYRPGESWKGGPDFQIRVVLETADWVAVGYRLPVLELVATEKEDTVVGHLGPDLLSPTPTGPSRSPTSPPSQNEPSARRCWTSGTSPGSGTSIAPRSASCWVCTRGGRCHPWTSVRRWTSVAAC